MTDTSAVWGSRAEVGQEARRSGQAPQRYDMGPSGSGRRGLTVLACQIWVSPGGSQPIHVSLERLV